MTCKQKPINNENYFLFVSSCSQLYVFISLNWTNAANVMPTNNACLHWIFESMCTMYNANKASGLHTYTVHSIHCLNKFFFFVFFSLFKWVFHRIVQWAPIQRISKCDCVCVCGDLFGSISYSISWFPLHFSILKIKHKTKSVSISSLRNRKKQFSWNYSRKCLDSLSVGLKTVRMESLIWLYQKSTYVGGSRINFGRRLFYNI